MLLQLLFRKSIPCSDTLILISQFCNHVQWLKVENSAGPLDNQTHKWLATHATALWPIEQSSNLSAKFNCAVAHQTWLTQFSLVGCYVIVNKLIYLPTYLPIYLSIYLSIKIKPTACFCLPQQLCQPDAS